ncbi:putative nuclease HARBI1, partial [Polypterus senegalus]|uniref:putative nuclease HARBI1 n=1 Tax=Polypterus senegalus TaxID=55291 RepID=UPI00196514A7
MACPFIHNPVYEGARLIRRALRQQVPQLLRPRIDPLHFADDYLYERYRFSRHSIAYLCQLLEPYISKNTRRSKALTVAQSLCIALRYFASGSFLYSVGDAEHLRKATVCREIRKVCVALKSFLNIFITFPGHRGILAIKETFFGINDFPNVIGAIDCTHVRIKAPAGPTEPDYINRKSYYSINVQMVCTAEHLISNIVAKWPGSVHDARI